jgi:hypothetical protein
MSGKKALLCLLLLPVFFLTLAGISQAELEEGVTTQGEFALWVIKEVGAISKLPPAATGQDAIDFLSSLGVIPEGGWKQDQPITRDFLESLLGDEEDASGLSWDELVQKVRDNIRTRFSDRRLGVFRATSSATGSAPVV